MYFYVIEVEAGQYFELNEKNVIQYDVLSDHRNMVKATTTDLKKANRYSKEEAEKLSSQFEEKYGIKVTVRKAMEVVKLV